jgi:nicotinate-nucleotide--dimethylbenzimidazole phosphoribosyltransferase
MDLRIDALDWHGRLATEVRAALDGKTKPLGSLGRLEDLALQLALVQDTPLPRIAGCAAVVFAADHGIAAEGVSPYPQAVTAQMVANFLAGGAAISVLARQLGASLHVVDAGVLTPCPAHPQLLSRRIAAGSGNFARGPALTSAQVEAALAAGHALPESLPADAYAFGEMGIGNTSSAAALMLAGDDFDATDCVGRGTGLDDAGLAHKRAVIAAAVARQGRSQDPRELLARYGGLEIAMMAGAMLGAAARRRVVVVDGFIATAAFAMALRLAPACRDYAVFAHVSAEAPHRRWLQRLGGMPLLDLGLRLGEGTGAVLALPLLRAATALLAEMASFASAGVSERAAP